MEVADIFELFKGTPTIHLATVHGNEPRVRPISLIYHKEELWGATRSNWGKVEQIKTNPSFEFSLVYKKKDMIGSLRARGKIEVIEDRDIKDNLSKAIPFFKGYWISVDDPYYTLLKFRLSSVFISDPSEDGDKIIMKIEEKTGKITLKRISREKYLKE